MAEISPLRRPMIEDMTVRNLSPATQQSYLNAVSKFGRYFGRSPDRLGLEDVRAFQVHLVATGISWPALAAEAWGKIVENLGRCSRPGFLSFRSY
jgi:integrase/recombinase XerD